MKLESEIIVHNHNSSHLVFRAPPPIAPRKSRAHHEFRPAYQEKQLPDAKKASLLASLSALETPQPTAQVRSVYDETPSKSLQAATKPSSGSHNGYSPSFGPAVKQRQFNGLVENNDLGGFRAGRGGDDGGPPYDRSLNSSVTSLESRKSNLMKELFGGGNSGKKHDDYFSDGWK